MTDYEIEIANKVREEELRPLESTIRLLKTELAEAKQEIARLREALQEIADMAAPLPPEAFNVTVLSHSRAIIFDIADKALAALEQKPEVQHE